MSAIIDKQESSFGSILEVQHVENLGSQLEFHNALLCMYLEDPIAIGFAVGHSEFLSQAVKRKDVGYAARVEVNRRVTEIGLPHGGHSATVTMDLNGFLGRVNVLDVCRVSE